MWLTILIAGISAGVPIDAPAWKHMPTDSEVRASRVDPQDSEADQDVGDFSGRIDCRIVNRKGTVDCGVVGEDLTGTGQTLARALTRFGILDMKKTGDAAVGRSVSVRYKLKLT